ncbi:hypothetical protein C0995_014113 [Termitomyces sp. Mi166|nr:hypothetical protein C0995_014113 [Termitomyces sp. Mi166\
MFLFELSTMSVALAQRASLSLTLKFCTWYFPQVPGPARLEIPLPPPPTHTVPLQPTRTIFIEHSHTFPLYTFLNILGYSIYVIFAAVAATIVLGVFFHVCHNAYLTILRVFLGPAEDVSTESGLLGPSVNDLARPLATFETPDQDDHHPVSPTNPDSDPTPNLDPIPINVLDSSSEPSSRVPFGPAECLSTESGLSGPSGKEQETLDQHDYHPVSLTNSHLDLTLTQDLSLSNIQDAVSGPTSPPHDLETYIALPFDIAPDSEGILNTFECTNASSITLQTALETLSISSAGILHPLDLQDEDSRLTIASADEQSDTPETPTPHSSSSPTNGSNACVITDSLETATPMEVVYDDPPTPHFPPHVPSGTGSVIAQDPELFLHYLNSVIEMQQEQRMRENFMFVHIIKKWQARAARRGRRCRDINEKLSKSEEERRELVASLKERETRWKGRVAALLERFGAHIDALMLNLTQMKTDNARLKTENTSLRNNITSVARTNDVLRRDVHDLRRSNQRLLMEVAPPAYDQALAEGAFDEWSAAVVSGAAAFVPPRRSDYAQARNVRARAPPRPTGPPPNCQFSHCLALVKMSRMDLAEPGAQFELNRQFLKQDIDPSNEDGRLSGQGQSAEQDVASFSFLSEDGWSSEQDRLV